ncbi:hypothetical protein DFH08DRAFT_816167 [Mycena albidolilacea]|uniref:Uncharacterized protein n=1 Tax=Mycena albidolilacea TaxID=1033008 RepID=A0AAD6ZM92_9AGAR|nr:hypothetical protein DFH08DRAFT_816167 [Mycena albidolilacea]
MSSGSSARVAHHLWMLARLATFSPWILDVRSYAIRAVTDSLSTPRDSCCCVWRGRGPADLRAVADRLFNGGALGSQVTDSQYINNLTERNMVSPANKGSQSPIHDASFNSSGSSDTTYDQEEAYSLDDPMDDSVPIDVWPSRLLTPMFEAHYAILKAPEIQLSATEARIIAAIRSDRDAERRQWMEDESHWCYNQSARIAALESLLEYHCIAFPPH